MQNAISHINQHTDRYNRAKGMLDSAGPWDAKDPDLAECVDLLDKEKAYIDSTVAKNTNSTANFSFARVSSCW